LSAVSARKKALPLLSHTSSQSRHCDDEERERSNLNKSTSTLTLSAISARKKAGISSKVKPILFIQLLK